MSEFYYQLFFISVTVMLKKSIEFLYRSIRLPGRFIFFVCLSWMMIISMNIQATHLSGSDVTYRWLSGNSYEVTVTLYRDCSGIPADPNVTLNYRSVSCGYNLN